jgi:hypothetical protein
MRSTIAGAIVGLAALATALAFSASLSHLLDTPPLYGVSWDARIGKLTKENVEDPGKLAAKDSQLSAVSVGYSGVPFEIEGKRVDGMAVQSIKGASMMPTPLRGRPPAGADEMMLGTKTMSDLHVHLGSTVRASVADSGEPMPFRVVGEGVFPSLSDAMGLGKGAATTPAGLRRTLPPGADAPPDDQALLRFRPGVNKQAAVAAVNDEVARAYGEGGYFVIAAEKPVDLVNFGRVQTLPLVLAALLGTLAAATLAHLLVTSIRRRRRDLAILKTLGFSTGQVRGTVAWQATTLAAIAAVVGIPVGVACGRWVWITFAHQLGIVARPATPWLPFVVLGGLALVVANLVALLPGRAAARVSPARALRTE